MKTFFLFSSHLFSLIYKWENNQKANKKFKDKHFNVPKKKKKVTKSLVQSQSPFFSIKLFGLQSMGSVSFWIS